MTDVKLQQIEVASPASSPKWVLKVISPVLIHGRRPKEDR
jgi:hypothetical protein